MKIMIRKINIIVLALSIIILAGCEKEYLDTKPTDAISEADALSTPENMMLVLNGLHRMMYAQNPLPDASWSRTGQSHFLASLDFIGGNIIHSAPGNGWMRADAQWLMHTDASYTTNRNFWYQRYHFINSVNSIINGVEGFTVDENLSNVLGQSHAYRAWAYHQLVMTYCRGYLVGTPASDPGVPIRLESGAPYESGGRRTVQEVYDQIETDIDLAISYLQNASPARNKSHISLNAAYGIKARISLSKGDWAEAAAAAISAREGYPIMDEADWKSGFNTLNLPEVMWGGHVIDEETNYYAAYFYYICPTFNGSQNRGNPKLFSIALYNQIPVTDYRRDVVLPLAPNTNPGAANGQGGSYESDPNYDNEADFNAAYNAIVAQYGITSRHNTHPYMHVKFLQKNPGTIDPDDVIYMRSSEMYLIEAEAEAMQGNIGAAQAALDALASARNAAFDVTGFNTQALLMDEIKFQRRVELYGEGFSFHDYIRWDDAKDMAGTGASSSLYQDGYFQDRPSVNPRWVWKIPQREIDSNPDISENDQNKY